MGELLVQLKAILEDLKSSWYFRVWSLFWVVCAIVALLGFGVFSATSVISGSEKDWNMWVQNVSALSFPRYHFRIARDSPESFATKFCTHNGAFVTTTTCVAEADGTILPISKCFAVVVEEIVVVNQWDEPRENELVTCSFTTTGQVASQDQLVAWEPDWEGGHHQADRSMWIAPNDNAWVLLKKRYIKPAGHLPKPPADEYGFPMWERALVYHSTLSKPGNYTITTILSSFRVDHIEQGDFYNGWMATGSTGGLTFFLVIIHTMAMAVVGIMLPNDSKFLNLQGEDAERSPIL